MTDTDPLSVAAPLPTRAVRLANGDTLISDQFNNRVIRVDSNGVIVASFGLPLAGGGAIGNNVGYDLQTTQKGLYSPYDAKIVGDYTGLTPPFDFDGDSCGLIRGVVFAVRGNDLRNEIGNDRASLEFCSIGIRLRDIALKAVFAPQLDFLL